MTKIKIYVGLVRVEMLIFALHMTCYWGMVYVYDDPHHHPDCFWTSARSALRNQLLVTLPSVYLLGRWYPPDTAALWVSVAWLPLLVVTTDLYFYTLHRCLHSRWLWPYHRAHHTGRVRAVKALDADPLEHLVVNLGSFACGLVAGIYAGFTFHWWAVCMWAVVSTLNTCYSHCPELDGEDGSHVLHHKHRACNYGVGLYVADRLLGSKR